MCAQYLHHIHPSTLFSHILPQCLNNKTYFLYVPPVRQSWAAVEWYLGLMEQLPLQALPITVGEGEGSSGGIKCPYLNVWLSSDRYYLDS
jgi:hypothetical protein